MRAGDALLGVMSPYFVSAQVLSEALCVSQDEIVRLVQCEALPMASYSVHANIIAGRECARARHEFFSLACISFYRMYVAPQLELLSCVDDKELGARVYRGFLRAWDDHEALSMLPMRVQALDMLLEQPLINSRRAVFEQILNGALLRVLRSVGCSQLASFVRVVDGLSTHWEYMAFGPVGGDELAQQLEISALLSELDELLVPNAQLYLKDLPVWALRGRMHKWLGEQERVSAECAYEPLYA